MHPRDWLGIVASRVYTTLVPVYPVRKWWSPTMMEMRSPVWKMRYWGGLRAAITVPLAGAKPIAFQTAVEPRVYALKTATSEPPASKASMHVARRICIGHTVLSTRYYIAEIRYRSISTTELNCVGFHFNEHIVIFLNAFRVLLTLCLTACVLGRQHSVRSGSLGSLSLVG